MLLFSSIVFAFSFTGNFILENNEIGYFDPSEISFDYEYTTALCEGSACRDYVVTCLDGEAINLDPISGMVIFSDDWEDTREDKGFCVE